MESFMQETDGYRGYKAKLGEPRISDLTSVVPWQLNIIEGQGFCPERWNPEFGRYLAERAESDSPISPRSYVDFFFRSPEGIYTLSVGVETLVTSGDYNDFIGRCSKVCMMSD